MAFVVTEQAGKMTDVEINQCEYDAPAPLYESQMSVPDEAATEAASGVGVVPAVIVTVRTGFVVDEEANMTANSGEIPPPAIEIETARH